MSMTEPSAVLMPKPKCSRCSKRYRGRGPWNATVVAGVVVGLLCPRCQTAGENAEAEINEATLTYGVNRDRRLVGKPKVTDA